MLTELTAEVSLGEKLRCAIYSSEKKSITIFDVYDFIQPLIDFVQPDADEYFTKTLDFVEKVWLIADTILEDDNINFDSFFGSRRI